MISARYAISYNNGKNIKYYDLAMSFKDNSIDIINNFMINTYWVYDCNSMGQDEYYFSLKYNNEYHWYKIHHVFYWSDDFVENDFAINEIDRPEWFPLDRDWYYPNSKSHPEINNWPPKTLENFKLKAYIEFMNK